MLRILKNIKNSFIILFALFYYQAFQMIIPLVIIVGEVKIVKRMMVVFN